MVVCGGVEGEQFERSHAALDDVYRYMDDNFVRIRGEVGVVLD